MMKVVLVGINAKYIHSNLAVYCLKSYVEQWMGEGTVEIAEYTINQPFDQILQGVFVRKPDFLGISCYLWNIAVVKEFVREYRKLDSGVRIWLGGPEVSFDPLECLEELTEVDGVMVGEGEETLRRVLAYYGTLDLGEEIRLEDIEGIAFRTEEGEKKVVLTENRRGLDFARLPFPYGGNRERGMAEWKNRIIYYESGRGCPFSCSYCLSSVDKTVRFRDWALVQEELEFFLEQRVPQVKFVDRTFNCSREHAMRVWRLLREKDNGVTNFHFEIAGDLLDEEEIALLNSMRPGLVQLEIGVQSLNPETLLAIGRRMDLEKIRKVIAAIREGRRVHQHLDLIAGLPYEDFDSFRRSFNGVYAMKPDQLQLGFLKVLKGAPLQGRVEEFGIVSQSRPPYEVLYTRWMSYWEVLRLKRVEEVLERYYNSGQFLTVMSYLLHFFEDAFSMYEAIAEEFTKRGLWELRQSRQQQYEVLFQFCEGRQKQGELIGFQMELFRELLMYDYCLREMPKGRPLFAEDQREFREEIREVAERERKGAGVRGQFHIEKVSFDLEESAACGTPVAWEGFLIFEYENRDPLNHNALVRRAERKFCHS